MGFARPIHLRTGPRRIWRQPMTRMPKPPGVIRVVVVVVGASGLSMVADIAPEWEERQRAERLRRGGPIRRKERR